MAKMEDRLTAVRVLHERVTRWGNEDQVQGAHLDPWRGPRPGGCLVNRRHMYHTEGMTDLRHLLADAQAYAAAGGTVVVHRHPYQDHGYDGCPLPRGWVEADGHEVFRGEPR